MFKRIHYNSPVILTFTLICAAVLGIDRLTGGVSTKLFFMCYRSSLLDPLFYLRLVTHVLGHISWAHFFGNFTIILLVGPMLEEKYGSRLLFRMMFATALLTGIINVVFFKTALLGASGIAFMFILLSSFANTDFGRLPITFILIAIIFIGQEVVSALFANDDISHMAHIIGGLCGGILGYKIGGRRLREGC